MAAREGGNLPQTSQVSRSGLMQRSALTVSALAAGALALVSVVGCAKPDRVEARPLPPPLLDTPGSPYRNPPTPPPPPPRPMPEPQPPGPAPEAYRLDTTGFVPPGGIRRGRWKVIVVHHAASDKATPKGMADYHRRKRGWINGLGYDFVIGNGVNYPDGKIYVGPRWTKQITGAHCAARAGRYFGVYREDNFFNQHGIGICLIGDFTKSQPTPRQRAALQALAAWLCDKTGISPTEIYGHGEVTGKTECPGTYMNLAAVRTSVRQKLAQIKQAGGWAGALRGAAALPLGAPWMRLIGVDELSPGEFAAVLGLDQALAAFSQPDDDGPLAIAGGPFEAVDVAHGELFDALDDVAGLDSCAAGGAGRDHIHDHHASCEAVNFETLAALGIEIRKAQPAPQHGAAAQPGHAAELAPLDLDRDRPTALAAE